MKRGYHHGNLRQALVEAALALIAEKGPQGFTLSEAAKTAEVTPAAVYRHFAGRDDLLAEVARQGFDIFAALMEYAWAEGQPSPIAAFEATGRAYLAFARRYPGHYQAMFESGLQPADHRDLAAVAAKARDVMDRAAQAITATLPETHRPPATMISAHIRALSHGVVELYLRGNGGGAPFPPEDLLESATGIYLRGLGLLPPDR
ncbi:TetR/AcrR family transcriptional regulator [Xinfangfangia sp. CPCC 101601]|uniref:TetR/AcrR family transcriptional regulator n=1 Tax=Pseudogemmobacter lacusdianii TaxID=3069608 RepID=A0ABU0VUQ7_9RHOB|nr:TetR/AcrR family transcriptional regulator [Xinfangfangia sp. CPCC 101601]MDQ2065465.1 TetR/AcrR family transcriptional regulator [Xinfangfangia sp. CPCC 101601]